MTGLIFYYYYEEDYFIDKKGEKHLSLGFLLALGYVLWLPQTSHLHG